MTVWSGAGDLRAKSGTAKRKIAYSALLKLVYTRDDKSVSYVAVYKILFHDSTPFC